ncbi:MAG: aminopeptidase P N-terminal domain-containing protein [Bacteroidia bacterium]|nr:aminopeptidase P N-terminal domain-containing protein [Bacteroidia bacterium]MCF8425754.1 aminopeptidase P N-terminal domain-containing protein [Bacteroidia bacterium]MCF8447031.1 aminopeptidase P N-terminal domain-containing protein [Bacteroidia bacterium]
MKHSPKYDMIPNALFVENRKKFIAHMKPNSIAIFHSNDEHPWNGDATHSFKQNSNLFWLTGVDQEETILVLAPDCPIPEYREALFIKRASETMVIWNGHKLLPNEATLVSGIENIFWYDEFELKMHSAINYSENIYLSLNENDRAVIATPYKELRFAHELKQKYPLHEYERASPILQRLRSIKSSIELDLMKVAVEISNKMIRRVAKFVKPGVWEYEIEAEVIHEYLRNKANGHSFHPIVASGKNSCILHYVDNNEQCKDGDILLLDSGADYANYASDMTRTLPVNGKFSPRQKAVYNAVLRVMKAAKNLLKPGTMLMEYHVQVGELMEKELVDLGLITLKDIQNQNPKWPAYKKYFMHGTSHFLGIDVHDVGMRYEPMKAGMTFSCEPGIYIAEEAIGIRLENEILITENGCIDLMEHIPIEAEDIESLMHS